MSVARSRIFQAGVVGAAIAAVLLAAIVAFSSLVYFSNPARECTIESSQIQSEESARASLRNEVEGAAAAERETCFWGHNAEQWIAMLTLWLVAGTILLAVFTAFLWLGADESARKQRAADEDAHKRQMRAYIGIKLVTMNVSPTDGGFTATAYVEFANFGKTPAQRVRSFGHFMVLPWLSSPFIPVAEADQFASMSGLAPTASRTRSTQLKVPFEWHDICPVGDVPAPNVLLVWGTIAYADVFGEEHRTHFKAYLGGNQRPSSFLDGASSNSYRMLTYWNGNEAD